MLKDAVPFFGGASCACGVSGERFVVGGGVTRDDTSEPNCAVTGDLDQEVTMLDDMDGTLGGLALVLPPTRDPSLTVMVSIRFCSEELQQRFHERWPCQREQHLGRE